MHSMIAWFARNGVAANLLMVGIIAGGIWAGTSQIILQQYPEFPQRFITVSVLYPGSTPTEIEDGILTRLEENLYDIEGIKEMTATGLNNSGRVDLEIEDGYDLSEKLDEVTNRVSTIRTLPPDAERPQISLASRAERVITIVVSGDLSERELKTLGEQLRDEVSNIQGISLASLKVVRPYEIAIEVSEPTLRQYGLSFDQITRAIRTSSVDLSAGSVKTETGRILLRTNEQAYTYSDFSDITVLTRQDGTKIKLGDIAEVIDGFDENPIIANFNGKRAIAIDVFRTGMQNAIEIGDSVKEFIALRESQLPEGITLSYWDDDTVRIKVRLATLKDSAIIGFILVVSILSIFLRPTLAFWVAWGIPIAFAGTFLMMPVLGLSINIVTLMAFITTLGIVVDDAIVTGENVFQHMQRGEKPLRASIDGTNEVAVPVMFGVITTMVSFAPLMMMSGFMGNFFKNIPMIVIPVLFFSLVESKLILPAHLKHCTHLGDAPSSNPGMFVRFQRFFADGLERFILKFYRPFLNKVLIHRYLSGAVFVGFLIIFLTLVIGDRIGFRRFLSVPDDTIKINLDMPPGTTFEQTHEKVALIEKIALDLKDEVNKEYGETVIQNVFATSGGQPFGSRGGLRGPGEVGVSELGEVILELTPNEVRKASYASSDGTADMRKRVPPMPEAESLSFSFARFDSGALGFELIHPDVEVLRSASADLQQHLKQYDGLFDIKDSYQRASEEYGLALKPQAEYLGVNATNLAQQVRTAFFGAEAQRIQRGRDEVKVMVRYPESDRRSLGSLHTMMIRTANGTEVPFETVAEIVPGQSLPSIRRVDRKRVIQVTADADTLVTDTEEIEKEILDNYLSEIAVTKYPGLEYQVMGFSADAREEQEEMVRGVFFILAVIYALLAIPFRSYMQPLIVMSAIPFGVVGAIIGHWIMAKVFGWNNGSPILTLQSIFGMMALSGVVVNDSLVMVHFMNRKVKEGMPLEEAVRLAGVRRFRPILLTSMTTFFGLGPLMFEDSPQAAFLVPMAISLAWGIAFATFITLLLVPVLVLIYNDLKQVIFKIYGITPHAEETEELASSTTA